MIRYPGSPETIHVVNWILYSGRVNPLELADKAAQTALAAQVAGEVDPNDEEALGRKMREELAVLLEEALDECIGEFAPSYDCFSCMSDLDTAEGWASGSEANYTERDANGLMGPLLGSALARIDLYDVADHIFVELGKAAGVTK